MRNKVISLFLGLVMFFGCGTTAFALEKPQTPQRQIEAAILSIDETALKRDALNNVVDLSVPASVRNSFRVETEITVDDPSYENPYEIGEVYSTVKNVGEIDYGNGNSGTMYVATAAVEIKEDNGYGVNLGAKVWSTVYWIDNPGANNELYAVDATWDTSNCDYETHSRIMRYGTVVLGTRVFSSSTTVSVPNSTTYEYIDCHGEYTGFSFACMSQMHVGPSPVTVTSWAITTFSA